MDQKVERFQQKETIQITTKDKSVAISFDTLKQWDRVVGIFVYSSTAYATNKNLQFDKVFKIDNKEIFCEGFDTFFLQNREEYRHFWFINANADGSKVEGSIVDPNDVGASYDVTVMLILERDKK